MLVLAIAPYPVVMSERYDVQQTVHTEGPFSRRRYAAWTKESDEFRGAAILEVHEAGVVDLSHVEVEEDHRGEGVAGRMVGFALSEIGDVTEVRARLAVAEVDGLFESLKRTYPGIRFVAL